MATRAAVSIWERPLLLAGATVRGFDCNGARFLGREKYSVGPGIVPSVGHAIVAVFRFDDEARLKTSACVGITVVDAELEVLD